MPLAVTVLPVPTADVAKVDVMAAQVTTSPPIAPVSVQLVSAALTVPSYTLLAAVTAGVTAVLVVRLTRLLTPSRGTHREVLVAVR